MVETNKQKKIKNQPIEKQVREREREYWPIFFVDNLEWIEERGGNEIIRNLYKNKDGRWWWK